MRRYSFMQKLFLQSLKIIILFLKNSWGSLNKPYETYRRLSFGNNLLQVLPLFVLIFFYLVFSTLAHHGLGAHPLILTLSFGKVVFGFLITYFLMLGFLLVLGKTFSRGYSDTIKYRSGDISLKNIFLPWTYSLLPTLIWFTATSVFYLLLPPPRTTSISGQAFSFFFIAFSSSLFLWKGILYYLTLRFGMRLDFLRILGVNMILFPAGFLYSLLMYYLGIFRVPFI